MNDFSNIDELLKKAKNQMIKETTKYNEEYDIVQEVCTLIVKTRNELSMTQKELSMITGISQANISKIENATYNPTIVTLKKIADGFGKRMIIMFEDTDEVD